MNPWPSPRAGSQAQGGSGRGDPAQKSENQERAVWMPCARQGRSPLGSCVRDGSPKGRDKQSTGSVHDSPPLAAGQRAPELSNLTLSDNFLYSSDMEIRNE